MINMVKLPTNKSSLFLRVAKGHFATSHSHINYYRVALGDRLLNDLFEKVRGFLLGIGVVGCDCHSRYIFHKITTFFRLCVYFLGR